MTKTGVISPAEFAGTMAAIPSVNSALHGLVDTERDHIDADFLMCQVLTSLGYRDGVDTFLAMQKWYA